MNNGTITNLSFSMEDPNYDKFKLKVDDLGIKYNYWLSKHEDVISGVKPIDLHNYYVIHTANGRVDFRFIHMESFPREIQEDLLIAFNEAYGT